MFTSTEQFYKSKIWKERREQLYNERLNDKGELLCHHCGQPIVLKYDAILHHLIELTEENMNDWSISLADDNLVWLHFNCHNEIHQRFGFENKREIYLVYGSPLSGKSSYVKNIAKKDDIICDIDSIYEMITNNPRYVKSNKVKSSVFQIRNFIIEMIKTRNGMWQNAFIVGGYPLCMERKRLCDSLGAKPIHIDTSKEECIRRLYENPNGRNIEEWKEFIEDYFSSYQPDELI